ncbi:MAG: DUF1285 domain-containing protein [Cellvibrionaceae bacterium]|nr:DUF1285 domain-containing protein [Cellvibrionaceae bacterium]MCV6624842.1 DUF1285 domain-containing protein [Cellvibrionaceae bacterium]
MSPLFDPEKLTASLPEKPSGSARPPVHLWNPELSGDLDMRISADGRWFHEGDEIKRLALVRLFASILKREGDDYFLVTPVEKWRIQIEREPFCLNQMRSVSEAGKSWLEFFNELGEVARLESGRPLSLQEIDGQSVPTIAVRDGLNATLSRSVYYELVNLAQDSQGDMVVFSGGERHSLGSIYD